MRLIEDVRRRPVWRLGVGLGAAHSEKAFGTGELGEIKKPSQALLLQIFREILLGWRKGCVKGTGQGGGKMKFTF